MKLSQKTDSGVVDSQHSHEVTGHKYVGVALGRAGKKRGVGERETDSAKLVSEHDSNSASENRAKVERAESADSPQQDASRSSLETLKSPVAFFVAAYIVQGISLHFGVISQPLQYFLMKHEGLDAANVSFYMSLLMVPWIIKPAYALLSDFVAIGGYRRRSYLLIASAVAGLSMLTVPLLNGANSIIPVLMLAGIGLAFSNVVLNALTVEGCRRDKSLRNLWSTQSISYFGANVLFIALGGYLCDRFGAGDAINYAVAIAGLMPLLFLYMVLYAVREKRAESSPQKFDDVKQALLSCVKSPGYLAIWIYMCLFNLSPICSVPLYFYESNVLQFSQVLIGQLNACGAFGMLCGGLVFKLVFEKRCSLTKQLFLTALISCFANLGFLLLTPDAIVASVIHFVSGMAATIAILALYGAASAVCPPKVEATAFAILIASYNAAGQLGQLGGGCLYSGAFAGHIVPLVYISAGIALACAIMAPLVNRRNIDV